MGVAFDAWAADAAHGRDLYFNTPGGTSCSNSSCHGPDVSANKNGIRKGANNPSVIQRAIDRDTGGMGILQGKLTSTDLEDLAAYIANPNVPVPTASLSPTSLSFGSIVVGSSASQTATLSNTGSVALSINSLTQSGAQSGDFVRSGSCVSGGTVSAGSSCTIIYSFKPSASGARSAQLAINTNASNGSSLVLSLSGNGSSPPVATLSPTALDFGTVPLGTSASELSATLANAGGEPLTIESIAVTSGDFSVAGGNCVAGGSLSANASCNVGIGFSPTATGARSGTLSVSTNAGTRTVALSGTGSQPATPTARLAPASLNFSAVVGTQSAVQQVTLSNVGSSGLQISGLMIAGVDAALFSIDPASSCGAGETVPANASCTVGILFSPTSDGEFSAQISIAHDDQANSPSVALLTGIGTTDAVGQVAVDAVSLMFADQMQGTRSASRVLEVRNTGARQLELLSLAITGDDASDFEIVPQATSCAANVVLQPNATCSVAVVFAPRPSGNSSSESRSALVEIHSDAINDQVLVGVSGTALPPGPWPMFSPQILDFGTVPIATPSAPQSSTLTNGGTESLQIESLSVSPADYSLSHDCPAPLTPGQSCVLQIVVRPTQSGPIDGEVQLRSNAAAGNSSLTLTAVGGAGMAVLEWAPPTELVFQSTQVGVRSSALTAELHNTGTGDAVLSGLTIAGVQASDFSLDGGDCIAGLVLAPSASCSMHVAFVPSAAGTRSAQLLASFGGESAAALALSGTGVFIGDAMLTVFPVFMTLTGPIDAALQPQALVLTNEGAGLLTVTGYGIPDSIRIETGGSIGGDCAPPPFDLNPGQSCSVMVVPVAAGVIDAEIVVQSNSFTAVPNVQVSGEPNTNKGGGGAVKLWPMGSPLQTLAGLFGLAGLIALRGRYRIGTRRKSDDIKGIR
jgi:hypothetical protein